MKALPARALSNMAIVSWDNFRPIHIDCSEGLFTYHNMRIFTKCYEIDYKNRVTEGSDVNIAKYQIRRENGAGESIF